MKKGRQQVRFWTAATYADAGPSASPYDTRQEGDVRRIARRDTGRRL